MKDVVIPDGRWVFPVKEGILRHHNPEAHDHIRHDTARPLGDTTGDTIDLYPPEWDDPSIHDGRLNSPQLPEAAEPAAEAPAADYWELRGDTIIRHIMTPRTQLFRPTDDLDGIPVTADKIDVAREFETTSTFAGEKDFCNVWDDGADDHRHLTEPRTGFSRFYKLLELTADGKMIVRGRETRIQARGSPITSLPCFGILCHEIII